MARFRFYVLYPVSNKIEIIECGHGLGSKTNKRLDVEGLSYFVCKQAGDIKDNQPWQSMTTQGHKQNEVWNALKPGVRIEYKLIERPD